MSEPANILDPQCRVRRNAPVSDARLPPSHYNWGTKEPSGTTTLSELP